MTYPILYAVYGIAKGSRYPNVRHVNINMSTIDASSQSIEDRAEALERISRNVQSILPPLCMVTFLDEPTSASDDHGTCYTNLVSEIQAWVNYAETYL